MVVETHVDVARETVARERGQIVDEQEAYEQFRRQVASISPTEAPPQTGAGGSGPIGTQAAASTTDSTNCRRVREAFAETVRPHSVDAADEEPLLETIREELGDGIAVALAPTTDHGFTPQTKQAIFAAVCERLQDLDATTTSLDREAESLAAAATETETVTEWLRAADETPLPELGFEDLRERHERLDEFRDQCQQRLTVRQELLQETTSQNPWVGLNHRSLVVFLYQKFQVNYPVLSTIARLDDLLADCQRTVRDHLTRRG